jgi:tetratricopeptide (TPR) repeat protein
VTKNKRFLLSMTALMLTVSPVLTGCDQWNGKVEQIKQKAADKAAADIMTMPTFVWPPSSAGEYLAARVAIGHDDLETANKAFGRAIDTAPNEASVDYLIEHALPVAIGTGDDKTALALSTEIDDVKRSASGQFALLLRLREDFRKKDWDKGTKDVADLRNDGFGQYIQPLTKVWMLVGQDKVDDALAMLYKANQSYPSFRGLFALHRALILDMAGRTLQAEKAYMDVLNANFSLRNALVAADFFARQHNQQALDNISQQIREKTGLPFSNDDLTANFSGDAAVKNAEQGYATILFDLATVLQQEGSSRLALLYARIAEPGLPQQPMTNVLLGDIFMDMKDYPQARTFYDRIAKDSLFFPMVQLRLADSHAMQDDIKGALATLQPLSEIPALKRQVLTQMGDLLRASKQFNEAIPYYTQVIDGIQD